MPLTNINYAPGQDSMQDVFDKCNDAIDAINALPTAYVTPTSGTSELEIKVIQIGDWNMDTTGSVSISHGISDGTKIRSVTAVIISDTGNYFNLNNIDFSDGTMSGGVAGVNEDIPFNGGNILLARTVGGFFDQTAFDSTSFNRGFITIIHEV